MFCFSHPAGSQVLGIQHDAPVLCSAAASAHDPRLLAVAEKEDCSSITVIDIGQGADEVAMLRVTLRISGYFLVFIVLSLQRKFDVVFLTLKRQFRHFHLK